MKRADYDVIIVGARAAGASLGILLGRQGKKVLLIDKAAFPSDTLSTHHLSHLNYLKQLGVLEEIEKGGLRKITRMRTYIGDSLMEGPRQSYTMAPRRDFLDYTLLKHALEYPQIEVLEKTRVDGLVWDSDRVFGVDVVHNNGERSKIYGELVVGADGMRSRVAEWVQAEKYNDLPALRPVFYGYYEGVHPLEEPATEIFLQDGRIGFLFPMEPGRDCLGLEIHPEEFKDFTRNPQPMFEHYYSQFYRMDIRLKQAKLQGRITGGAGVENFFRTPYGKGWALIGDAAHSKDPSTGLGINDAFLQSFLLAEAIDQYSKGADWKQSMERFQQQRDMQLMPAYQLTLDYIQSVRPWSEKERTFINTIAANPIVWNKLTPHLPELLEHHTKDSPLLWKAVKQEAESLMKGV
ncbi:FAD-dependent oxidoreductase [Thalassobacillus devorans]|uniref:FAD-dependent oxidoreductase n=1 Tax=Thalassobacillus devorans TaxID=279813 RepID=A0ABQ1PH46_9BACI|nr:NAD(P)/FAD-dependent oxidoreductase [Thalassobacillus devorans]NIK29489.1 2-polyprenyl-6-methoxyphenol hydroxylase-like FAD-dependent oxidoreductase [Thalassobacillus devorans]GGC97069.1 FAD-dependent oxidoreductase [Thalassobacillus devorans]